MASRSDYKAPKKKKSIGKKILIFFIVLLIIIGGLSAGAVWFARRMVAENAGDIINNIIPAGTDTTQTGGTGETDGGSALADISLPPSTPEQITEKMNSAAQTIVEQSRGLVESAQASVDGSTVTYNLQTSRLNNAMIGAALMASGDQLDEIANKVLDSMEAAGTQNPRLDVNIVDDAGNILRTIPFQR